MKTKIIKIGNSRGIRLPKVVLNQIGIENEVDLEVDQDKIIIKPIHHRRAGWEKAFQKMAANSDDQLLDENEISRQSSWDDSEWVWETE